jgi:hypothetical protein
VAKNTNKPTIYSYWVVEVDHGSGRAQVDFDATNFWISRQFSPESNIMYFTEYKDGMPKRNMVNIDVSTGVESAWDEGRLFLERALSAPNSK